MHGPDETVRLGRGGEADDVDGCFVCCESGGEGAQRVSGKEMESLNQRHPHEARTSNSLVNPPHAIRIIHLEPTRQPPHLFLRRPRRQPTQQDLQPAFRRIKRCRIALPQFGEVRRERCNVPWVLVVPCER